MPRRTQLLIAALLGGFLALPVQASETVQVRGGEHDEGFARIAVEWAAPVAFDAKLNGDTLTIHFTRPFTASLAQLTGQLQHYISRAGQSADGTSIIATVTRPVEIKTATINGTIASIDLVARPEKAATKSDAKAPSLQPEAKLPAAPIVEQQPVKEPKTPPAHTLLEAVGAALGAPVDLLQPVQTAGTVDQLPPPAPAAAPAPQALAPPAAAEAIQVRGAEHGEGRARIALEWRSPITFTANLTGDTLTIRFPRPFTSQFASLPAQLPQYVAGVEQSPDRTSLTVTLKQPVAIKTSTVDGKIASIDLLAKPTAKAAEKAAPKSAPAKVAEAKPAVAKPVAKTADTKTPEAKAPATTKGKGPEASTPALPKADTRPTPLAVVPPAPVLLADLLPPPALERSAPGPGSSRSPPASTAGADNPGDPEQLKPALVIDNNRASLRFDWAAPVGAAIYRRGSAIWIAFSAPSILDLSGISPQGQSVLRAVDQMRLDGATALRLVVADGVNPSVRRAGNSWIVDFVRQAALPDAPIVVDPRPGPVQPEVQLHVHGASLPLRLHDPLLGDNLTVVPVDEIGRGVDTIHDFVDFRLLPSVQGIVIRQNADDLTVAADADAVHITRPRGLALSDQQDRLLGRTVANARRIFDFGTWRGPANQSFADRRSALERAIAAMVPAARTRPRLDLARFYFANLFGPEALSVLAQISRDDPAAAADPKLHPIRGAACLLSAIDDCATQELGDKSLDDEPEAALWRGSLAAGKADWPTAAREFLRGAGLLVSYPKSLRNRFALQAAQALLETDRASAATPLLDLVLNDAPELSEQGMATYLKGRVAQELGELDQALDLWSKAAATDDRKARARALYAKAIALYEAKRANRANTIKALDGLRFAWRGDDFEFTLLRRLGELKLAENDFQGGLDTLHLAATYFSDFPAAKDVAKEGSDAFADVFIGKTADDVPPVKALALYDAYRDLDPPGERHDAIVKKLVDRLVSVDLLDRAADLLDDQVKNHLTGLDKARAATQVALLRLMNHQPDAAITALDLDVGAGTTPDLARQRQELRARALFDLNRAPEALAMLGTDNSRDAYRLRADIYWRQRDWKNAAKTFALLAGEPPAQGPLDAETARVVMSWAAALTLDGNQAGVTKLRQDFGALMAGTSSADAFNIIAGDADAAAAGGGTTNEIAARVAQIGTLQNFMAAYKQRLTTDKLSAIN